MDEAAAAVRACEAARCAAIAARDWDALGTLLDTDYVHVHGNGRVTDRAGTIARLAAGARDVTRGPLDVRLWGDTALIVGEQVNHDGAAGATRAMVSQVLRRRDGAWRFVSLHFTAITPARNPLPSPAARGR